MVLLTCSIARNLWTFNQRDNIPSEDCGIVPKKQDTQTFRGSSTKRTSKRKSVFITVYQVDRAKQKIMLLRSMQSNVSLNDKLTVSQSTNLCWQTQSQLLQVNDTKTLDKHVNWQTVVTNRSCRFSRKQFANIFVNCCCVVHAHTNLRLQTRVRQS